MASPNDGNLFLPLDVNFWDDPDILAVGFMGGVLYQHMLMLSKRTMSDGEVSDLQIRKFAIPGTPKLLQGLERRGLVVRCEEGWVCPAYLKRNRAAAEIKETQRLEREGAALGNHHRWHKDKFNARCDYCTGRLVDPNPVPDDDPNRVPDQVPDRGGESTETETRSETEPEPRTEPRTRTGNNSSGEPTSSSRRERSPRAPRERDLVFEAICEVVGFNLELGITDDERGMANRAWRQLKEVDPDEIRRHAANYLLHYPDSGPLTPQAITRHWTHTEKPPTPGSRRNGSAPEPTARIPAPPKNPCPDCGGARVHIDDAGEATPCETCAGSGEAAA